MKNLTVLQYVAVLPKHPRLFKAIIAIASLIIALLIAMFVYIYKLSSRLDKIEIEDIEQEDVNIFEEEPTEALDASIVSLTNVTESHTDEHQAERNDVISFGEYDRDGFPTGRTYLTRDEFKRKHITDNETKKRFDQRKKLQQQRFVSLIKPKAKELGKKYGIPWRLIVAQAIKESAYGMSRIAVTGYNLFGHKLTPAEYRTYEKSGVKGLPVHLSGFIPANDDDPSDKFRQYTSIWESMETHAKLIANVYKPQGGGFPECLCSGTRKYATSCKGDYVKMIKQTMSELKD